ncbi:EF-hand domain-containing protein [Sulfitobacter sp. MF3-043]|uniref:EF-hand domain-containing protein n=1 Tax=Sulfitobacter sediminivivens TaxID=3252902 RepID=UPI0036DAEB01
MTRKIMLAASVLAVTAIGSTAFAASDHGHKGQPWQKANQGRTMQNGGADMMGHMDGMSGMMGMMHRMHGNMMDGMGPMGGGLMKMMDADGDGNVTPEEMREVMQAKLTEYDSDGNGSLSIAEFETLHSAAIREMMVDRFQHLDADGDGAVTPEEMMAPADKMDRMQKMRSGMMNSQGETDNDENN